MKREHARLPGGRRPARQPHPPAALSVVYADRALLAAYKPSGLFVHRTALGAGGDAPALQRLRGQLGGEPLYPVHRLDRATSGLLLFARDPESQRTLSRAFATREIGKRYLGIVRGWPPDELLIDAPLARLDANGRAAPGLAQAAQTRLRTLARVTLPLRVDRYPSSRYALVELGPQTGRRHQLRRHVRKSDHPLIGDTTYGQGRHNRLFRCLFGEQRLLLCAVELDLRHPLDGRQLTLSCAPDSGFWCVLSALGCAASVPERWQRRADSL